MSGIVVQTLDAHVIAVDKDRRGLGIDVGAGEIPLNISCRRYPAEVGRGRSRINLLVLTRILVLFKKRDRTHLAWPGADRVKTIKDFLFCLHR